jgi:SAM-dependent methyltransferase
MRSLNRIVMQKISRDWIRALGPETLDVAEISGRWGEGLGFKSHRSFHYPEYDPCAGPFRDGDGKVMKFDLIMANQVWEHIDRPFAATRNVLRMLRPGGWFWIAVPFFIPYHAVPVDCSRWSARGLRNLLVGRGSTKPRSGPSNGAIAQRQRVTWNCPGPPNTARATI